MATDPILIIDDNPANLKVARFALETEGYQVWTAGDAEEALVLLREIRPSLILMDIQLPGMDGLELTRQLKADPTTSEIVVVAVTAYAMKGDRERALHAGCDGYVTKPIDPILLPTQVADHLARSGQMPFVAAVKAMPVPVAQHDDSNGTNADGLSIATHVSDGSNRTVLLIEDNPATRRMYRLALETAGYNVVEARDGGTGLDALRRRRPDLIIQDLILPDMDGLELARSIRATPGAAALPILCVSGFLSRLDEARAIKGGFAQVLVKPLDPFHLLDAVKIHLTSPSAFLEPMGAGRLLIVVDDDPLERKLAQVWFSSAGFNVLVAGDGDEALALAHREHPVAIVSDVLMPKMDGFTLCLTMRRDPELAGIPVILTSSAYSEKADHELARRLGASALLPKAGGLEGVTRALTAALEAPTHSVPTELSEVLEHEHDRRARAQLERQVLENTSLLRRSTVQQAQLAVLGGIADALAKNVLVDGVLGDVLASCLDMAGVSKGALYLTKGDEALELKHHIGFSEAESLRLRAKFGHADLFAEIANRGRVVAVPSTALSSDLAQRLIIDAGVTLLLIVPVTAGIKTYGAMLLGARNADVADEAALAFARVLGGQMAQAVGMAEAFGRLEASELRYRRLFESAKDGILILDAQTGQIVDANPFLMEMLGYSHEECLGKKLWEVGSLKDIADCQAAFQALQKNETIRYEDLSLATAGGRRISVEFISNVYLVDGQRVIQCSIRDITERKKAEAALQANAESVRRTLDNIMEGCQLIGFDWRYLYLNDAAEIHNRRPNSEMLGRTMLEMWPGIEASGGFAKLRRCMDERIVQDGEWEFSFADGTTGWFDVRSQPVSEGILVLSADITERRQAERKVRASEERFRTLADSIPQLAWVARGDGFIDWYNRRWYDYTGTTPEQMEGWGWRSVHDPTILPQVLTEWPTAIAAGEAFEMEFPLRAADGRFRRFLTRAVPIKDAAGHVMQWFGTNTDVHELKQAQAALYQAHCTLEQRVVERTEQLEVANKELEAFSYSVSHDLRAPLRAINGFAHIVLEDFGQQLPEEGQKYLERIRNGGEQMGRLIDDLLAFSRLSRESMSRRRVDTAQLVKAVLDELNPQCDSRQIEINVGDLPPGYGDPALLKQVWANLLSNAIKYSRGRTPAVVEIGCRREEGEDVYFVRDNGAGFDMTYAHKLFGVFQRLHRTDEFEGTGVGLAIVQRVVHRHGGRVWAEAEVDRGATFHFTLAGEAKT